MGRISIKKKLDRLYSEFDFSSRMRYDPIRFPHRYGNARDRESVAFLASCLAYGQAALFSQVLDTILSRMGSSPYDFLLHFDVRKEKRRFHGIKYRFNENDDIICLLFLLHTILRKFESLEKVFMGSVTPGDRSPAEGLSALMTAFVGIDTSKVYGRNVRPAGLVQFFPSPARGSACKRPNLFLRWMVRDRDIDLGLWTGMPKSRLIIPLDTHIARISGCLGFTARKSQDWRMAVEITEFLKRLDPEDPLKYDFALCHHGISGLCRGKRDPGVCRSCPLVQP